MYHQRSINIIATRNIFVSSLPLHLARLVEAGPFVLIKIDKELLLNERFSRIRHSRRGCRTGVINERD